MLLELLASVAVQVGVSVNTEVGSTEDITYDESAALHLRLGPKDSPFYLWGSFSKGDNYILGQNISSSYNYSGGVGYEYDFSPKFYGFLEGGIGYPHNVNSYNIQQEVSYTYLVGRHNVYNRPVPVRLLEPYDQSTYESNWDLDYGAVIRAGVGFNMSEHWKADLAYKYFNPQAEISIWQPEYVEEGGGWWTETVDVNMNVVELRVLYEF